MTVSEAATWALGLATLFVAAVAAVFAIRNDRAARAANREADSRLIPRIHCLFSQTSPTIQAEVFNIGGATPSTLIFVAAEGLLWSFAGVFPEHSARGIRFPFSPMPMIKTKPGQLRMIVYVAQDVHGRWWDNLRGTEVKDVTTHMNKMLRAESVIDLPPSLLSQEADG